MNDIKGKKLEIGDDVVFIKGKNSSAEIGTGKITKIYPSSQYGEGEECSVGGQAHIYSYRVMKLNNTAPVTGVIRRDDYAAFSDNLKFVTLFCSTCDPTGEGGHGGIIYSTDMFFDDVMKDAKMTQHFCPTCGRKIDYSNIVAKRNYLK